MGNKTTAIKHQHDAFGAYGSFNDWSLDTPAPTVEIYMSNGRERSYVSLSIKEAEQAIEIIKDAMKAAEKEAKQRLKIKKRGGRQPF